MTRASRVHEFGDPDVIVIEEIVRPVPGPGEVLVRVHAAGVGPWDAWVRSGKSVLPQPLPLTLGADLSGVVVGLGEGVTGFVAGDEVFGVTNPQFTGACSDYAVAMADMIAGKPKKLSHVEAASVPVVAVTAWQMLFEHAGLLSGQSVLILGGAGNVGGYAIQFAHRRGLQVTATGYAHQVDELHRLGADRVIAVDTGSLDEISNAVDAVIDTIGGDGQSQAMRVLKPGGVLVSAASQPDAEEARRRGIRTVFFLVKVNTLALRDIAVLMDGAELKPRIGLVLPMSEMVRAHEVLEGKHAPRPSGKIVIDVLAP